MKLKYVALVGMVALLSVACTNIESQQSETQPQTEIVVQNSITSSVEASGTFVDGEHSTKGTASIITENGKKYIQFDNQFKTDSGPDLFVILHKDDKLTLDGIKKADYVSIARLKKTSGSQKYEIPVSIDIANFKSVAIWCRLFNVTFGYAAFKA